MFKPASELILNATDRTNQLVKQICHDTLEEHAQETVANLILVAYLISLTMKDLRPQDTSKEDDLELVDEILSVISSRVEEIKFSQLITEPSQPQSDTFSYLVVDRLRDIHTDRELEDNLPEEGA